ncbi:TetR/AcrR family transcriptional regulator [uncultured Pseudacidovorax sp.]|uniref:TetR/AcrR family transcriptional regulator n=1 Tax=uncultured Pseudacidovorax sp. TaxID=679313 RepID=UPI0025EE5B98|nr:TetR/AcrR family transcriptional regulator [uncultured Pseudacidovorax sp.]
MTRTRADDYEDKKRAILEKAAALIARKGFDQATMMDVAKACNASKSHLYHYFPSKEDLLFAVVHEHIAQQTAELRAIVALPLPAEERFARFIDSFVQGAARSRSEHLILMADLKFLPRAEREQIRVMEVELADLLEQLLGEINPTVMRDPKARKPYSLLLFGMMIWTFTWYRKSGQIPPRELAARVSALWTVGFVQLDAEGRPINA